MILTLYLSISVKHTHMMLACGIKCQNLMKTRNIEDKYCRKNDFNA